MGWRWSEEQTERALRAAERDGTVDGWGDLPQLHEVSVAETMRAAGQGVPDDGARGLVKRGEVHWARHPDRPRRPALVCREMRRSTG